MKTIQFVATTFHIPTTSPLFVFKLIPAEDSADFLQKYLEENRLGCSQK